MGDPFTIVVWSIGVVAMMLGTWIQDRRDIRRENGEVVRLREAFNDRLERVEKDLREATRQWRDLLEGIKRDAERRGDK